MAPEFGNFLKGKVERAAMEYKKGPLTPELVDKTWQILWGEWGKRIGVSFRDIPSCDRTPEELALLQKENKAVLLIPDILYTEEGLILLGNMFPKMKIWAAKNENEIKNEVNKGGCIDIEKVSDSPNRGIAGYQATELFRQQGREGQRLATYIIGSQLSKLSVRQYFDEITTSYLLGSNLGGNIVTAHRSSSGDLI